ncbi:hypothetical protein [Arthrobacter sp. NPDC058127]
MARRVAQVEAYDVVRHLGGCVQFLRGSVAELDGAPSSANT